MTKPRVDAVHVTYYRKGKCEVCGKQAEREKTFTGPTYDDARRQAARWEERPIRHKRCE